MLIIRNWFERHFSDPQVVALALIVLVWSVFILLLGRMLAPVIAAVIIAYLLEGVVGKLEYYRIPRFAAVVVVTVVFILIVFFSLVTLLPLLAQQLGQLFQRLPSMIGQAQQELLKLPEKYPDYISEQQMRYQLNQIGNLLRSEITTMGQRVLSFSVASIRSLVTIMVYVFIVPLLVFFCLKDKERLLRWFTGFLPRERTLATRVWREVDQQIGNYVRGKVWEILIIWSASYLTFTLLGLEFAILLGLFVGLSVLIPYIGAIFMGLPVALVAYFQWGWGHEFAYVVVAYTLIQLIDGNILATLLFSEVVNLHPIAIIVSILVFGGIWGFWGLFFAIPLATLVQAILRAWPKREVGRQGREPEGARQKENSGEASPGGVEEEKIQRDIHAHG